MPEPLTEFPPDLAAAFAAARRAMVSHGVHSADLTLMGTVRLHGHVTISEDAPGMRDLGAGRRSLRCAVGDDDLILFGEVPVGEQAGALRRQLAALEAS